MFLELRGLGVVVAELALEQAVNALDLLLFAQLDGVVGQARLLAAGAVLAGLLLQLALGIDRTGGTLQAEVCAFATGEFAGGSKITCHLNSLFFKKSGHGWPVFDSRDQKRSH